MKPFIWEVLRSQRVVISAMVSVKPFSFAFFFYFLYSARHFFISDSEAAFKSDTTRISRSKFLSSSYQLKNTNVFLVSELNSLGLRSFHPDCLYSTERDFLN